MSKDTNRELVERYPFLLPRNVWTDKEVEDYDYSYTLLDNVPDGWRRAFGIRMCEEIRAALNEVNYLDKYRISQIKEKFGSLRWYDFGGTEKVGNIIHKYEHISEYICISCGRPYPDAKMVNAAWISPYCKKCWGKNNYEELTKNVSPIGEKITIHRYSRDGDVIYDIPIKETWDAIVSDYYAAKEEYK